MSGLKKKSFENRWIYYTCSVSLTLKSCCNFSTFRSKSNHFSCTFCFSRETEATFDRSSSTLNNKYHRWKYIFILHGSYHTVYQMLIFCPKIKWHQNLAKCWIWNCNNNEVLSKWNLWTKIGLLNMDKTSPIPPLTTLTFFRIFCESP